MKPNWGVVIIDLAIIALTLIICIWQNNPKYLWLLALLALTDSYTLEEGMAK